MAGSTEKVAFEGVVRSVQPRIRLGRAFDETYHTYHGYVLAIEGAVAGASEQDFGVAIGKAAHAKHGFRVGDRIQGRCHPVVDPRLETALFYKASGLEKLEAGTPPKGSEPPFHTLAPPIEDYRALGHRRLDAKTFETKCASCVWACNMPVEITIDHWNPEKKRYRFETFCYGPDDCALYHAGKKRVVPGRRGMRHVEEIEDREIRRG